MGSESIKAASAGGKARGRRPGTPAPVLAGVGAALGCRPPLRPAPPRLNSTATAVSPVDIAEALTELWSPRVVAAFDDNYVKVAKVQGTFGWHRHPDEDELFHILRGRLRIELRDGAVTLEAGQMFVVPRGVEHCPVAEQECLLMLIERKTTLHSGDAPNEKTRSIEEQLGQRQG
jgi:mannose-6-phosphate isomerase-like protein (cupin superfamily)